MGGGRRDVAELLTTPGFIDIHTHLREPSTNLAETIANGTRAAMLGGFVMVADMPNNPGNPTWTAARLDEKRDIANRGAYIPTVFYAGCQPEGDTIGELAAMSERAIGLKLYGDPTTGSDLRYEASEFREIVEEWHRVVPHKPIVFHSGQHNLEDMIGLVAHDNNHPLHIAHVNHPQQVQIVGEAKYVDMPVTCGVCPHHLLKTSHARQTEGKFAEMMPPLADQPDTERLMRMLDAGDIDIIETDYAPHSKEAKWQAEHTGGNCFGVPGIEHVVPLLMYQVKRENISLERLIDALSTKPAALLGVTPDAQVEWDMEMYRIEDEGQQVSSGAKWSPYLGHLAIGRVRSMRISDMEFITDGVIRHLRKQR